MKNIFLIEDFKNSESKNKIIERKVDQICKERFGSDFCFIHNKIYKETMRDILSNVYSNVNSNILLINNILIEYLRLSACKQDIQFIIAYENEDKYSDWIRILLDILKKFEIDYIEVAVDNN